METINGALVVPAEPNGLEAEVARGPVLFGPTEVSGAYTMLLGSIPPGEPAPPIHLHPGTDEGFYIAAGELTVRLGDRDIVAPAGTFVFVPRGVAHTAWNSGDGPMRGLLMLSPGDAEHTSQPVEPLDRTDTP